MFLNNERKYGWNEQRNHYRRLRINWSTTPTKTAEKTKGFKSKYDFSSFVNVLETAVENLTRLAVEAEEVSATC